MDTLFVVISGSFRRHLDVIQNLIKEFELLGIPVLSPAFSAPVNPGEEFVVLKSDNTSDVRTLEDRHLAAIARANALYICCPDGYVGLSAALEIGFATANGILIFSSHEISDITLSKYIFTVATPKEVKDMLTKRPT